MGIDDRNVRAVDPRQYGRPLLVSKAGAEPQIVDLAPIPLRGNEDGSFDEDWLQDLIFQRPGLLLIVGDGIRQGAENLAKYLQRHAGAHFTLGLVELSVHRLPEDDTYLVQPRILARTVNIERGIVRLGSDGLFISAPAEVGRSHSAGGGRRTSITHEMFYEQLAISDPILPRKLQKFVERLEPLGVLPDLRRAMSLKWQRPDGNSFNLASITSNEEVRTDLLEWAADTPEEKSVCRSYVQVLAAAIDGNVIKNDEAWFVSKDGNPPTIVMLLETQDQWLAAIEAFTDQLAHLKAQLSHEMEVRGLPAAAKDHSMVDVGG